MSNYIRSDNKGATFFFTVVTHKRQPFLCNSDAIAALREAIVQTKTKHPFTIDAWVVLPDHMHAVWTLPQDDADFGVRWSNIKRYISRKCGQAYIKSELVTASKVKHGESGLWQRRFWEHQIRDETDFRHHMDYIHYNPVKHGLVKKPLDWQYSTLHKYVKRGNYPKDWGCGQLDFTGDFGE